MKDTHRVMDRSIVAQFIPNVIGKYFRLQDEIYLLHREGDNLTTLVHGLLHSIHQCSPNRENIVSYLTYRITQDASALNPHLQKEWEEIERDVGFKQIISKLVRAGDCEDYLL